MESGKKLKSEARKEGKQSEGKKGEGILKERRRGDGKREKEGKRALEGKMAYLKVGLV